MNQKSIAEQLASLTPQQRELALQKLRERKARAAQSPNTDVVPLKRVARDADLPLSSGQQRLWFLDQMEGPNPYYNEFGAFRVEGALNVNALEHAFRELIERHEALRTTFPVVNDNPVQRVGDGAIFSLQQRDLRSSEDAHAEVVKQMQEESMLPFDLANGPLLRATLIHVDQNAWVLMTTMHHIICDHWSSAIFTRDLIALYQQCSGNGAAGLPELSIQYADFAAWQRERIRAGEMDASLSYWRSALEPLPPVLELPTERKRPAQSTYEGLITTSGWDAETTQALKDTARKHGASLFMVMLTAYAVVLARYSCQEVFLLGVPSTTRNRKELEPLIGFFVNTLVLKMDVRGNPSFAELIPRVVDSVTSAYQHQELPLDHLMEALQVSRETPLFRAMLIFQNAPMSDVSIPGLRIDPLPMPSHAVRSDIDMYVEEEQGGLHAQIRANRDLFSAPMMETFARRLSTVVTSFVLNPETRIDALEFDPEYRLPPVEQPAEVVLQ